MAVKGNLIYKLERLDWDFPGVRCASAFSTVHWHPCRYVSQIPAALIGLLSKPNDLVLDPFCGSGTTVVEAQRLGRRSISIDINPVAKIIVDSKTVPHEAKVIEKRVRSAFKNLMDYSSGLGFRNKEVLLNIPESVQKEKWYSEKALYELAIIWSYLEKSKSTVKPILEAAFSSILLPSCNEDRHWGYVCDNTKPKSIRMVEVFSLYKDVLEKYIEAYYEREKVLGEGVSHPLIEVDSIKGNSIQVLNELDEKVDLIVTSPPYFGMCDYIKSQRLSFEWLGFNIEEHRRQEIGARSKRHRKKANTEYISELQLFLNHSYSLLKKGGFMCLVIGQSSSRKSVIDEFEESFEKAGFELFFDTDRSVPVQRRQHPSLKDERIYILRK